MNNYIYALFSCDEWKSKESFRLIAVYDDFDLLKNEIKKMVNNGEARMQINYIKIEDMELTHLDTTDYIAIKEIKINEALE